MAKQLVWKLKFERGRAAVGVMAQLMLPLVSAMPDSVALVPAPTATGRTRQRGYDQALLLARRLARHSCVAYLPCLQRHGQSQQRGATRQERLVQLAQAFLVTQPAAVQGKHVVLVDDVLTTGATIEAAAAALKAAGARRVSAVVFAQA
ncbi:MAG TPA: phosphoribosyltransferase family protein [Candidatus Saccharimonadales bacterium]|nr:phosphoribosyltransferase family protein [Candidatus Saccharimonadales bacterium]